MSGPSATIPLLSSPQHQHIFTDELQAHRFGRDDSAVKEKAGFLKSNTDERARIVKALGGDEAVRKIPTIVFPEGRATRQLILLQYDQYIPSGSISQTEDDAGRKAVLIKLYDNVWKMDLVEVVYQCYRETDARACWKSCYLGKNEIGPEEQRLDEIVSNLEQVMTGKHIRYSLRA